MGNLCRESFENGNFCILKQLYFLETIIFLKHQSVLNEKAE